MAIANEANSGGRHPAVLTSDANAADRLHFERRLAWDKQPYTKAEFQQYYGDAYITIWSSAVRVSSVVKLGSPPLHATDTESRAKPSSESSVAKPRRRWMLPQAARPETPFQPSSASSFATHASLSPPAQAAVLEPMSLALSDEDWLDYRKMDWLDEEERWKRDRAQEILEASWYTREKDM